MKKFSVLLSALLISCMMMTTCFASSQLKINDVTASTNSDIEVPVVLTELPEDISDISAVTVRYEYDKTKLSYAGIEGGVLTDPVGTDGNAGWYNGKTDGTGKVTSELLSESEGVLFTLKFNKISGASGKAEIKITFQELADSEYKVSKDVTMVSGSIDCGTSTGSTSSRPSSSGNVSSKPKKDNDTTNGTDGAETNNNDNKTDDDKTDDKFVIYDIADDNWAYASAATLLKKQIITGDSTDGTIVLRPTDPIKREEAAKMSLLAIGAESEKGLELGFADAESISDWARDYIATAVKHNIISGYEDNTVRSKNTITREEMIAMLIKAFGWGTSDRELTFADNDQITWSKPYIARAVELGILTGYDDNTVKPKANITRAESFALMARCIELNEQLTK